MITSILNYFRRTKIQRQMVRDLKRQARSAGASGVTDSQIGSMACVEVVFEERPDNRAGFTLIELLIVISIIAILASVIAGGLGGCTRSNGERAGIVTKFSQKGFIWPTYEGELHYAGSNGTIAADSWVFSIDNGGPKAEVSQLVDQLTKAQRSGKRVVITYRQLIWAPPWRGETHYFVQSVESVDDNPSDQSR